MLFCSLMKYYLVNLQDLFRVLLVEAALSELLRLLRFRQVSGTLHTYV